MLVDLGGTYYNTKPQVEALKTLLRKLPDPPDRPQCRSSDPNHGGHSNSTSTKSRNS
jgi:hypothetical protein